MSCTVFQVTTFARHRVGHNSLMIALTMANSGPSKNSHFNTKMQNFPTNIHSTSKHKGKTNFTLEWLDIGHGCKESVELVKVLTPHLSRKMHFALCALLCLSRFFLILKEFYLKLTKKKVWCQWNHFYELLVPSCD